MLFVDLPREDNAASTEIDENSLEAVFEEKPYSWDLVSAFDNNRLLYDLEVAGLDDLSMGVVDGDI
jgi:hypothetical protein